MLARIKLTHISTTSLIQKVFEDIKRVIIIHKSKDMQHPSQNKKNNIIERFFAGVHACVNGNDALTN